MNNLTIATGWCADKNRPKINTESYKVYQGTWLYDWARYHRKQINADFFLYESFSDVSAETSKFDNIVRGNIHFSDLPFRHDWVASFLMAAQYAFLQGNHLLYIEQDCLVTGVPKFVNWALVNSPNISYGFGDYSFQRDWAEMSCVFAQHKFLTEAIHRLSESGLKDYNGPAIFETIYHDIFKDVFKAWPFGYGRVRPINFNDEVFYGHQMSDEQIDYLLKEK